MTDIAKLRAQIAAGTYRVDADSIAGALLDYANVVEAPPQPPSEPASARIGEPLTRRQPDQHA